MKVSTEFKVVAFVHAKGSSTRVPSKNLRILGDKPLFCHAICNALHTNYVSKVIIDSESSEVLALGQRYGATPLLRPEKLATNSATGDDLAYWQASNYPDSNVVLQVVPTAPFLRPESIDGAIKLLLDNSAFDSVAGVYEEALYQWIDGKPAYYLPDGSIPNSNVMRKTVYETTGLYVNSTKAVLKLKRRLNPDKCLPYVLSKIEATDINTLEDFEFAEYIWRGLHT